jgi:hypothetical protein
LLCNTDGIDLKWNSRIFVVTLRQAQSDNP